MVQRYVLPPAFFIRYDKIDEEHVQLVALLNGLSASVEGGDPDDMLAQIQQFTQVLGAHFISEESLMAETRYPRYEEHCQQHQECLDRVISILGQLKAREPSKAPVDAVFDILVNTVARVDLYFAEYLIGIGLLSDRSKPM